LDTSNMATSAPHRVISLMFASAFWSGRSTPSPTVRATRDRGLTF
jgi:hypothetical protein